MKMSSFIEGLSGSELNLPWSSVGVVFHQNLLIFEVLNNEITVDKAARVADGLEGDYVVRGKLPETFSLQSIKLVAPVSSPPSEASSLRYKSRLSRPWPRYSSFRLVTHLSCVSPRGGIEV